MSCNTPVIVDQQPGSVLVAGDGCNVVVTEQEHTAVLVAPGMQGPAGPAGPAGADGADGAQGIPGFNVVGAVPTDADLPLDAVAGEIWVVRDTGHGQLRTATGWVDIGAVAIQGPPGARGKDGQIRYTGQGAPATIIGAEPGDTYLDVLTGTIYKLM